MALSFTASKNIIKRHYYDVYMRSTATAIASGNYDTLAHWATFLALFNNIGYLENKTVKLSFEPADPVELQNGEQHFLAVKGAIEMKYLQSTAADATDLDDMADEDCDLLLVSAMKWIYVHNKRFKVRGERVGGEIESSTIYHEQIVADRASYFSEGAIPTT